MKACDQSKSSEKIRYGTITPFWNCVCEGGSWNGKSGAEAVFVYATKSQHLRLSRVIKSQVWHRSYFDKVMLSANMLSAIFWWIFTFQLKSPKNCEISATAYELFPQNWTHWRRSYFWTLKCTLLKISILNFQDGGPPPSWKSKNCNISWWWRTCLPSLSAVRHLGF